MMDQQQLYKYRAFISYSHADEEWAKWLHKSLETYRMPKRLVGRETEFGPVPDRIAPVFRDRDELATATNLGPDHPEVGGLAGSLAYWLIESGDSDEAEELIDEALAVRRKALGADHPQVASAVMIKAYLLLSQGQYAQAQQLAATAKASLIKALPEGSWQIAAAMNIEGAAMMRLNRFTDAEPLLVGSQEGLKSAPIPNLADRGRLRLIELYQRWGKPDQVQKLRAGG